MVSLSSVNIWMEASLGIGKEWMVSHRTVRESGLNGENERKKLDFRSWCLMQSDRITESHSRIGILFQLTSSQLGHPGGGFRICFLREKSYNGNDSNREQVVSMSQQMMYNVMTSSI